jgi:hypothetical protein
MELVNEYDKRNIFMTTAITGSRRTRLWARGTPRQSIHSAEFKKLNDDSLEAAIPSVRHLIDK